VNIYAASITAACVGRGPAVFATASAQSGSEACWASRAPIELSRHGRLTLLEDGSGDRSRRTPFSPVTLLLKPPPTPSIRSRFSHEA